MRQTSPGDSRKDIVLGGAGRRLARKLSPVSRYAIELPF